MRAYFQYIVPRFNPSVFAELFSSLSLRIPKTRVQITAIGLFSVKRQRGCEKEEDQVIEITKERALNDANNLFVFLCRFKALMTRTEKAELAG
ncbi:hypothetical protein COLO4_05816 [Corchorus olitorius]|uniref:Uncharacterized protein n=1 Tax=Corchorus olitorius TaxID=93759 RepID=A0A1R3KPX3_9ROSI|nr:hypothetical protein COLO4_05816 [Corchorus olitorius]